MDILGYLVSNDEHGIKIITNDSDIESDKEDSYNSDDENYRLIPKENSFYFDYYYSNFSPKKNDPWKTSISYKNKIHDRHDYIFHPFKFLMEIDSEITPFKKNIVYEFENFINPFSKSKDVINFAKPYLDNVIKFYEKYSFDNKPIIKGQYAVILCNDCMLNMPNDFYKKIIDHKNNKILYEPPENRAICLLEKGKKYKILLAVDIYINPTERENFCISCSKNKSNIFFENCAHLVLCDDCQYEDKEERKLINKCPICNISIGLPIKIDLPL